MSNVLNTAFEEVKKCQFKFQDNRTIEVLNAFIFWTNFSGKPNAYGNSARTFNLAVPEEAAKELANTGWRVRSKVIEQGVNEAGELDPSLDKVVYFVNIKVNMDSQFPPSVCVFTEFKGVRNRRALNEENIGEIDKLNIQTCDCTINAYESRNFPGKKTGYLRQLYIIADPDVQYNGKYDDWLNDDPNEELPANVLEEEDNNY